MASPKEVEIKFRVEDLRAVARQLRSAGFRQVTPRTFESNTLFDRPNQELRRRGEILRLREYGGDWVLTHKARGQETQGKTGRHKTRIETETKLAEGKKMEAILRALGYEPSFRYEKFRAEWADGTGHVVLDETPIGNFGEIEGPPRWIDATASRLGVKPAAYVTQSYAELFFAWKGRTRSSVREMTFRAVGSRKR